jgi:hypothetical protein
VEGYIGHLVSLYGCTSLKVVSDGEVTEYWQLVTGGQFL